MERESQKCLLKSLDEITTFCYAISAIEAVSSNEKDVLAVIKVFELK